MAQATWLSRRPAVLWLLSSLILSVLATPQIPSASPGASPSSLSGADLICHTSDLAECYPRVFEPTEEFQRVHEDQELPPGLHVRLNVYTGEREAKINDPSEDVPAALEGLPVDRSVVIVDQPRIDLVPEDRVLPPGAPAYDPVGAVKEPAAGSEDLPVYSQVVATLKEVMRDHGGCLAALPAAEQARLDDALEQLGDLAHDVYFGSQLAADTEASGQLLCLMSATATTTDDESRHGSMVAQRAAAAMAAALQNNPKALAAIERSWATHKALACGPTSLGELVFSVAADANADADTGAARRENPAWLRVRLSAIGGLIKSDVILQDFVAADGTTQMLRLLVQRTGPVYESARTRAAHLLIDTFLDADMGATATWPHAAAPAAADDTACAVEAARGLTAPRSTCWAEHASTLAGVYADRGPEHWSAELWRLLQAQDAGTRGAAHDEL